MHFASTLGFATPLAPLSLPAAMLTRIATFLSLMLCGMAHADGTAVKIGLDAEFSNRSSNSAQAIEQGIRIAMAEINQAGGVLGGRPLELITRDNRSIPAIAKDNLLELAAEPDLVAVFGGRFSPPYIECTPIAQELAIPLLDPWGAADAVIDHKYRPSYTFRLSLRDSWVGPALLKFARMTYQAARVGVLLPNTAWGRSNQTGIQRAVERGGVTLAGERWYNLGDTSLITLYQQLRAAGAQAIVLIANEPEGAVLVRELAQLPAEERLPIVSHWGITGGDFAQLSGNALHQVDLAVIQTFSFIGDHRPVARRVAAAARRRLRISANEQIKSPIGLAQAYDLTHLLARAINQAGSTDRRKIRDALEHLGPYDGLVQRYQQPFSPARHEALSAANILFARYTADDTLVPIARSSIH